MNKTTLFFGAIVAAVICIILAIYYAIPHIHHVLTFGGTPADQPQLKHIALFAVLAIICIIAALVTRPNANSSSNTNTSFR
jgi:H+/Cl- antiporter ClcA